MSQSISASRPRIRPSPSKAARTRYRCSWPWNAAVRFSCRSSAQRTGRRSRSAAAATATSSRPTTHFRPNPPPTSGAITLIASFRQAEGLRDPGTDLVRDLGGGMHDQLVVAVVPFGQAGASLQRQRGDPRAGERRAEGRCRPGEDGREPVVVEHHQVDEAVAVGLLVQPRRGRGFGLLDAGHRGQRIPVHLDQFDRVLGPVGIVGDHHRHRLARRTGPSPRPGWASGWA